MSPTRSTLIREIADYIKEKYFKKRTDITGRKEYDMIKYKDHEYLVDNFVVEESSTQDSVNVYFKLSSKVFSCQCFVFCLNIHDIEIVYGGPSESSCAYIDNYMTKFLNDIDIEYHRCEVNDYFGIKPRNSGFYGMIYPTTDISSVYPKITRCDGFNNNTKEVDKMANGTIKLTDGDKKCIKQSLIYRQRKEIRMLNELNAKRRYKQKHPVEFDIKEVIYSGPATIVLWKDGTKTVIKQQDSDPVYDKEKALAIAIVKKLNGNNGSALNVFEKFNAVPSRKNKKDENEKIKKYSDSIIPIDIKKYIDNAKSRDLKSFSIDIAELSQNIILGAVIKYAGLLGYKHDGIKKIHGTDKHKFVKVDNA